MGESRRVALLARPGEACDKLRAALREAGGDIVIEADPATLDPMQLRVAAVETVLVARARVLIQNELGDQALSVKRLAGQLGCTADYLSHVFSQTSGEHLAAYINRQRMERGAHLLREGGLAGKEIAWACGFATQSYFIRNFRAHFGTTPKAWRAAHEAQGASDQPGLPSTRARSRNGKQRQT